MINLGTIRPGSTILIPFAAFDSNDPSASVIVSDFVVGDIGIYKALSMDERASTSGVVLLDTDGINIDGATGIHGFSIDLSDNDAAGFYAAGSHYYVTVGPVTIDAATVNFVAATFMIGYPDAMINTTVASVTSQTQFILTVGPAEADVLIGCTLLFHDVASAVQLAYAYITDYIVTTKEVICTDPVGFTFVATDNVSIFLPSNVHAVQGTTQTAGDLAALINTVDDLLDTEVAAIKTDTAAILADTGTDGVVVNAAGLATDAVTEIVSGVWDRDATSNQTTGTFGEALGDPAATGESIRQLVGEFNAAAAVADPSTTESVMQYVKQIVNVLVGSAGIGTFPAEQAPANAINLAEVIRAIHADVTGLAGSAMAGTDNAALASVVGALNDAAAADEVTTGDTLVQYIKQLINILVGGPGVVTLKAAAAPASGVSLSEMIRAIYDDTNSLDGTKIPNTISLANINAEVDTALGTTTYAEPTGVPPSTDSLSDKIGFIYMALRNKILVSASKKQFHDDAGNVEWEKDLADDGTDYTESEGNAP